MKTFILSYLFIIVCIVCWAFNAQSQVTMCSPVPQCPFVTNGTATTIASCGVQLCPMEKQHKVMKVFYRLLGIYSTETGYGWGYLSGWTPELNKCSRWATERRDTMSPRFYCYAEWKWVP